MSGETMSPGISAASFSAPAAPVVEIAVGSGIGAEIDGGLGFDNGSPTFSGLGRSDVNIPSFNQSIFNPGETGQFKASIGVPEGPVRGDIFGQTEIIAINPNIDSSPTIPAEPVSILDNTSPFQIITPINEGPPPFSLKDAFTTAKAPNPESTAIAVQPEIAFESLLESRVTEDTELYLGTRTAEDAIEDLKFNDPLTAMQLESDLASVAIIADIASQVTDKETAAVIVNSAIDTAVDRAKIIEKILAQTEEIPETEDTETKTAAQRTSSSKTDSDQENKDDDSKDNDSDTQTRNRELLVRDEPVDEARISHMSQAIDEAYGDADGDQEIKGTVITSHMSTTPPSDEQSGYAKMLGMSGDGTYTEFVEEMGERIFDAGNIDQAKSEARRLAEAHYAVTIGNSGRPAEEKQAEEVRRGGVAKAGVIFSSYS